MQLSVFLTPILSQQLRVGYGVCEELAVFSQDTSSRASSQQQVQAYVAPQPAMFHEAMSHQAMPMADMSDMSDMSMMDMSMMDMSQATPVANVSEHKADSQAPPHQQVQSPVSAPAHDLHHALCNFCFLFGHSVLPPAHTVTFVLVAILVTVYAVQIDAIRFLSFKQNKNLRPQGRAPPQFIL